MLTPFIQHFGVGSIPWSPLARGLLTRPFNKETTRSGTDRFLGGYKGPGREGTEEIVKRVEELAKKKECSMAQIALAWIMAKDGEVFLYLYLWGSVKPCSIPRSSGFSIFVSVIVIVIAYLTLSLKA